MRNIPFFLYLLLTVLFISMICLHFSGHGDTTNFGGFEDVVLKDLASVTKSTIKIEIVKESTERFNKDEDTTQQTEPSKSALIMKRIKEILNTCGDLCDTTKHITPGDFMGSVTSKVSCKSLFSSSSLYEPSDIPPLSWNDLDPKLQNMYNYGGRVTVLEWFINDASLAFAQGEQKVFSKELVEKYISSYVEGNPMDAYANGSAVVGAAADQLDLAGKTVLVMGTQNPWVEAIILSKNPKKVVTLEYGDVVSEYPGLSFIKPNEFRERYLNGTLDKFDAIFSFSSLEHSGLGRYGDPLNPWGDIQAVAQAWCVASEAASLVLSVPTFVNGEDQLYFNAHRIYGPVMYPFLATNWRFVWPTREIDQNNVRDDDRVQFQPAFVFQKITNV